MEKRPAHLIVGIYYSSIFVLLLSMLGFAKHQYDEQKVFRESIERFDQNLQQSAPALGQESVNKALIMFNIKVPKNVQGPIFDAELDDRGITTKAMVSDNYKVFIGPSAFESWSLLGSTLAHEIEVHCDQSFMLIALMDRLGFDGTGTAERHAYQHELDHAHRFGLSDADRYLIQHTVDLYYPKDSIQKENQLITWMAASLKPGLKAPVAPENSQKNLTVSGKKKLQKPL